MRLNTFLGTRGGLVSSSVSSRFHYGGLVGRRGVTGGTWEKIDGIGTSGPKGSRTRPVWLGGTLLSLPRLVSHTNDVQSTQDTYLFLGPVETDPFVGVVPGGPGVVTGTSGQVPIRERTVPDVYHRLHHTIHKHTHA